MAEQPQDGQERTEKATPKRLEDARKKGQVARSRELTSMVMLFGGGVAALSSSGWTGANVTALMARSFDVTHARLLNPEQLRVVFTEALLTGLTSIAPILFVTTILAIAGTSLLGGMNFSVGSLAPKLERLDPVKGLARVFGIKGLVEMLKAVAKFVLILGFAVVALSLLFEPMMAIGQSDLRPALADAKKIVFCVFMAAAAATVLVAAFDVPFQLWEHAKRLRMSHKELKDELKETEGSPELKARQRAAQQEMARRRMMEAVPDADVVITNPDHYAVALKFDPATMAAPRVVAKGVEHVALKIRSIASDNQVTVAEAPPLARALYYSTKLDQEVPQGLYLAVARVLAYVFQLREGVAGITLPSDLPIPAEFRREPAS
ncbi:MAG: flagellar biosynthesis protein FlhB [Pseudomonadota bacterium]